MHEQEKRENRNVAWFHQNLGVKESETKQKLCKALSVECMESRAHESQFTHTVILSGLVTMLDVVWALGTCYHRQQQPLKLNVHCLCGYCPLLSAESLSTRISDISLGYPSLQWCSSAWRGQGRVGQEPGGEIIFSGPPSPESLSIIPKAKGIASSLLGWC